MAGEGVWGEKTWGSGIPSLQEEWVKNPERAA